MTRKERSEWLAGLKEGDEVAVAANETTDGMRWVRIRRLLSVNSRGFIWKSGRNEQIGAVRANGRVSGPYGSAVIFPVTDEIRAQIQDREDRIYLGRIDWSQVPPETVRQVSVLLRSVAG